MRPFESQIFTRTMECPSTCSLMALSMDANAAASPVSRPSASAGCTTESASRSAVFAASLTASASARRRAATTPTNATATMTRIAPAMIWMNTRCRRTGASRRTGVPAATSIHGGRTRDSVVLMNDRHRHSLHGLRCCRIHCRRFPSRSHPSPNRSHEPTRTRAVVVRRWAPKRPRRVRCCRRPAWSPHRRLTRRGRQRQLSPRRRPLAHHDRRRVRLLRRRVPGCPCPGCSPWSSPFWLPGPLLSGPVPPGPLLSSVEGALVVVGPRRLGAGAGCWARRRGGGARGGLRPGVVVGSVAVVDQGGPGRNPDRHALAERGVADETVRRPGRRPARRWRR